MSDSAAIPVSRLIVRSGAVLTLLAGLLVLSALPGCPDASDDDDSSDDDDAAATCEPDSAEPDNEMAAAGLVTQGDNGSRTLCPDDRDWLHVVIPAWRAWRVTLTTEDPLDITAAGYDEAGGSVDLAQGNLAGGIQLVLEHPEICPPGDDDDAVDDDDDSAQGGVQAPEDVDRYIELNLNSSSAGLSYQLTGVEEFPCAE